MWCQRETRGWLFIIADVPAHWSSWGLVCWAFPGPGCSGLRLFWTPALRPRSFFHNSGVQVLFWSIVVVVVVVVVLAAVVVTLTVGMFIPN